MMNIIERENVMMLLTVLRSGSVAAKKMTADTVMVGPRGPVADCGQDYKRSERYHAICGVIKYRDHGI